MRPRLRSGFDADSFGVGVRQLRKYRRELFDLPFSNQSRLIISQRFSANSSVGYNFGAESQREARGHDEIYDLNGAGKVPIRNILDPVSGIGHDHADGSAVRAPIPSSMAPKYLAVYFRSYV